MQILYNGRGQFFAHGSRPERKIFQPHLVCVEWKLWLLHVHFSEVRIANNDGFIYYNVERSSYQIASHF